MTINIDFDGTCVTHSFPEIGKDIGAQKVLKKLTKAGHKLILFTMRSNMISYKETAEGITPDTRGHFLNDAIKWFMDNNIPLYGVQSNPDQHTWTESPKSYAEMMIDDSALGCPLTRNAKRSNRPYANWHKIEQLLIDKKLIK